MNINGIYYLLKNNGYLIMNSNVPFIRFFCRTDENSGIMNVIGCIDNVAKDNLTAEQLDNIAFQVERKFLLSRTRNVNTIFFIYSDDFERDKKFCECQSKFWILDTLAERVIVFENQPEDFDGIRVKLESMINQTKVNAGPIQYKRKIRKYPWITLGLLAINIIYFFVLESMGSTENTLFMLNHGAAFHINIFENHEYYRLLTCMFMHFGFAHLLNNMIALLLLGNEAEKFYGKTKFFVIYMISGLFGSLISSLYYQYTNGLVISAGASGAIYGIIGALIVKIVEDRRKNMTTFGKIGLVLILLVMAGKGSGNVDNIAHIGGFVAGMLSGIVCYFIMSRSKEY